MVEKGKPVGSNFGTDDELLSNTGFETGSFLSWTHDGAWTISTTTPYSGTYCVYDVGNHWLRQDITLTSGVDIILAKLWCKQPEEAIAAVDFFYTDGSYDEELIWPTANWVEYDVTWIIDPAKFVEAIRVWGYSGGGSDPDETFYDDFSIQTAGGGPANMAVTLNYISGSPVPPGGGGVLFDVTLQNNETFPVNFDLWVEIPPQVTPPAVPNRNLTFPGGFTLTRPGMYWPIPASWPAGSYSMIWLVGNLATLNVWASDSFPFFKDSVGTVSSHALWEIDGDPLDQLFEGIEFGDLAVSEFALVGNYPNPFNPATTINFTIDQANQVNLAVYDLSGREVATLVDGYCNAGAHEVQFDASQLASGVYVYRLTSGANTASGKMVLMK
jgi:hypothetical protein